MDILIITKVFATQIIFSMLGLLILFIIFEFVPLLFGAANTIRKNFKDFLLYQVGRGLYAVTVGAIFLIFIYYFKLNLGMFNILSLNHVSQAIIIYFFAELVIYAAHMSAHKFNTPLIASAHRFHHTVTYDMEWTNSKKEHLFIIALFMFIFITFCFVVFKSSALSHVMVTTAYLFLNSFSHYRIPLTIKYLDYIFLFPKDHLRHHTIKRSGPYGVTLSLFDTIFNTRK